MALTRSALPPAGLELLARCDMNCPPRPLVHTRLPPPCRQAELEPAFVIPPSGDTARQMGRRIRTAWSPKMATRCAEEDDKNIVQTDCGITQGHALGIT
ncbi:hypothetical protein J6590_037888 [Homalodisca vitripennis]|nr:hypothetical protein J6590_037888 [Homalodisca vitripennis]